MPVGQCPILKHYMWTKKTEKSIWLTSRSLVFTSTKIDSNSKKRKNCDDSSSSVFTSTKIDSNGKKRKIAQGCHVCSLNFSKGSKKKCTCGKYCHKSSVGKCLEV